MADLASKVPLVIQADQRFLLRDSGGILFEYLGTVCDPLLKRQQSVPLTLLAGARALLPALPAGTPVVACIFCHYDPKSVI